MKLWNIYKLNFVFISNINSFNPSSKTKRMFLPSSIISFSKNNPHPIWVVRITNSRKEKVTFFISKGCSIIFCLRKQIKR